MSYDSVLNEYVNCYDDNTLIELEADKKSIESLDDLLAYLDFAISHNYYTGHYWNSLYNYDSELERITKKVVSDKLYFNYLVHYCDMKADIFILNDSSELLRIESENEDNHVLQYVFDNYDELLTQDELDNIYFYDEYAAFDYINEIYEISESLQYYINYDKIFNELSYDDIITLISDDTFIIDYNKD